MSSVQQPKEMRAGIPRIQDLNDLQESRLYRDPAAFNDQFLKRHSRTLAPYSRHWGPHPFRLWSRRWEYPYAADAVLRFAAEQGVRPHRFRIMDAGSGVTFFPYYICSLVENAEFDCVDYDPKYQRIFETINISEKLPVRSIRSSLQEISLDDGAFDGIVCISVLEHTNEYELILDEFLRLLRPGGLFVLTFDLSLDGKFTLPHARAATLLSTIQKRFHVPGGENLLSELDRMHDPDVLTTEFIRDTQPDLLPWTKPVRIYKAAVDFLNGKGWTTGFRSRTVFCCSVRKPSQ